jgi:quinol monooxygenase YgiN
MMIVTEYRTKPGKREELFEVFRRLLTHPRTAGRDVVIWSNSTTERDASFLFEYWSNADSFADLAAADWYREYVTAVDELVKTPPVSTVTVPRLIDGL